MIIPCDELTKGFSRNGDDYDGEYHEAELRVFWQCFQEDW